MSFFFQKLDEEANNLLNNMKGDQIVLMNKF